MSESIQDSLGYWVNRLANAMWADLNSELSGLGSTPGQWGVLGLMADTGPIGIVELANRLGIDRAAVSRHVTQLEQKTLVKRTKHPSDNRQALIALTDKGRELVPLLQQRSHQINGQWLEALHPDESAQLLVLLQKMISEKKP